MLWLAWMAWTLTVWARPPGQAMVTAVSGGPLPVQLFDRVGEGQTLKVPAGAGLSLIFLEGGRRFRCLGPVRFKVGRQGPVQVSGQVTELALPGLPNRPVSGDFHWDRMAALRRGTLELGSDPTLENGEVDLRWSCPAAVTRLEVTVESLPDFQRVFRGECPAGEPLHLSLAPGRLYALGVRGFGPNLVVENEEERIYVLSAAERERFLEWEEQLLRAPSPEGWSELCAALLEKGLRRRAATVARRLREAMPQQGRLKDLCTPGRVGR